MVIKREPINDIKTAGDLKQLLSTIDDDMVVYTSDNCCGGDSNLQIELQHQGWLCNHGNWPEEDVCILSLHIYAEH